MHPSRTLRDYVYTSQAKGRDKFHLKNLLQQHDQGFERNYISQQSERQYRSNSRPQTMYGERVRLFLNDEEKRVKIQTEIKLRRQQSSYKVIKSSSGVEIKSVPQQEKVKMKKALGKINVLSTGNNLNLQQFFISSHASHIDNHYKSAFQYLLKRLRQLVFVDMDSHMGKNIKNLADRTKSQFFLSIYYRNLGKTTYVHLCSQLLKEIDKAVSNMQEALKKETSGEQKSLQMVKQKQQIIKKLKRELKYYQEHPSQDLYPYVKKLQRQNKQMKEQIQQLLHLKGEQQYSIEIYEASNQILSEQIQTLKAKLYQYELEELSGMKKIENNSDLKLFEQNVQNLKDMLDKSKLKMEGMKQEYDKLKYQYQQLLNQRSILAKRAAVGFGELTPRPNMKAIFQENQLIMQNYVNLSKKSISTQNIMKSIVGNLRSAQACTCKNKNQLKYNQSDIEPKDQMQNTLNYIDKTKEQIKKTVDAVSNVKKSLNKQKSDKEALAANRSKK